MEKYRELTVADLRNELKKVNAKLTGRKEELIERLFYYHSNKNFGHCSDDRHPAMELQGLPPKINYSDVHSGTVLPSVTVMKVLGYLRVNGKNVIDSKAQDLYRNGHLNFLQHCGNYVKSNVSAQMKKYVSYEVNIVLQDCGEVAICQCECPVGSAPAAHCKHVTATLVGLCDAVNGLPVITKQTCTSQIQSFHRPRKAHSSSPVKAENLGIRNPNDVGNDVTEPGFSSRFYSRLNNYAALSPRNGKMGLSAMVEPANMRAVDEDHDYFALKWSEKFLDELHLFKITKEQISDFEKKTRQQSESNLWRCLREVRITASKAGPVFKSTDKNTWIAKSIVSPSYFTSKYTVHGQIYEKEAIRCYEVATGTTVTKCGFFIHPTMPFVGASPDGLIGGSGILEVKCPFTSKGKRITPVTVPYLMYDADGSLTLDSSHDYYFQIMCQMDVTGRDFCHFFVYTLVDHVLISVPKCDVVVKRMRDRFLTFFQNKLRPEILQQKFYRQ